MDKWFGWRDKKCTQNFGGKQRAEQPLEGQGVGNLVENELVSLEAGWD
jgi:hypothetical protein